VFKVGFKKSGESFQWLAHNMENQSLVTNYELYNLQKLNQQINFLCEQIQKIWVFEMNFQQLTWLFLFIDVYNNNIDIFFLSSAYPRGNI